MITSPCFTILWCMVSSRRRICTTSFSQNALSLPLVEKDGCGKGKGGTSPAGWRFLARSQVRRPDSLASENIAQEAGNTQRSPPQLSRSFFLSISTASVLAAVASPPLACARQESPVSPKDKDGLAIVTQPRTELQNAKLTTGGGGSLEESISGFVAGGTLTLTKTLVKHPLDTATVRLQMPQTPYSIWNVGTLFEGSFRGIVAPLISNVPAGAVFFAVKDAAKASLRDSGLPKWLATSMAVAAAQLPYWLVRNPSEVVKTRQQAGVQGYGEGVSAFDALKLVMAESDRGSIVGLYTGYWENVLYAFPADVIKFVCYEALSKGKKNLPPLEGAVYGAICTGVAQLITTPLDVVRNRVMAKGTSTQEGSRTKKASYLDSLSSLATEEGLEGLFAGASPRVGKAILSGAIQFATYEETKQAIAGFFERTR